MKRKKDGNAAANHGTAGLAVLGRVLLGLIGALTLLVPLAVTGVSLYAWPGQGEAQFVGLSNYRNILLYDDTFYMALGNSALDFLIIGVGGLALGFLVAWGLRGLPGGLRYIPVAALCVPLLTSGWLYVFQHFFAGAEYGLLNVILSGLGLQSRPALWLSTKGFMPVIVRGLQLLTAIGPAALIISAGLDGAGRRVRESAYRQQIRGELRIFWQLTLPAMRMPLMLAAAVTALCSLGTARISRELLNITSTSYTGYPLWLHVTANAGAESKLGTAAALLVLTMLFIGALVAVMCTAIMLLTRRGSRLQGSVAMPEAERRIRKRPGPARLAVGVAVGVLCCLLSAALLARLIVMSLMPLKDLYSSSLRLLPSSPVLDPYRNLLGDMVARSAKGDGTMPGAAAALLGAVVTAAAGVLMGLGLTQRMTKRLRSLLAVMLILSQLTIPAVCFLAEYQPWWPAASRADMDVLLWMFQYMLPLGCLLGLSLRAICRGRSTTQRLAMAAAGCLCALVLPVWYVGMDALGSLWRGTYTYRAVGYVLMDMVPLLLCYPLTAGLARLISGANARAD